MSGRWLACALLGVLGCGAGEEAATRLDVEAAKEAVDRTQQRVAEGAKVAGARLQGVRSDLERAAGQIEGVAVDAAQEAVQQAGAPNLDEAALVAGAEAAITCADGRCRVTRDYAARLRSHMTLLAGQARVQPETRNGRAIGMRIVEARKLPELLGLRAGDVITRVNGVVITSVQAVPSLYFQLRAAQSFRIEYERAGEARKLVVDVG